MNGNFGWDLVLMHALPAKAELAPFLLYRPYNRVLEPASILNVELDNKSRMRALWPEWCDSIVQQLR